MASRTLNSKRNIIVSGAGSLLTPVFGIIIKSAILRSFSVEYIGLTSVFGSMIGILTLAEFGFSSVAIINLFKPIREGDVPAVRRLLSFYRRTYRMIGGAILLLGFCASPLLKVFIKDIGEIRENVHILYFFYIADTSLNYLLFGYKEALFNAAQRLDVTKILYLAVYILKNVLQLVAITVFKNFYLFAFFLVMGTMLYNILIDIASRRMFAEYYPEGWIDAETRRTVREQAMGLSIANVMVASRNTLDSIIITSFFSLALAGQYSNYLLIFNAVAGIISVIVRSIRASVGDSIVSESIEKNLSDFTRMEFLLNIFITACSAYLIALYQPFMKLWMGKDLLFDDGIMALFVLYYYVRAIPGVRHAYFGALGYWWKARWIYIAELLLNIVLNITMGRIFGVAGILMATIMTDFVFEYYLVNDILFREYFSQGKGRYYADRVLYTVVAVVTCGTAYYLCNRVLLMEGIAGIGVKIAVCTLVWATMVPTAMYLLKKEDMKASIAFVRQIIRA